MLLLHLYYLQSTSVGIRSVVESRLTDYIMLHFCCCCRSRPDFWVNGFVARDRAPFLLFFFRRSFYKWVVRIVTSSKPPKTVLRPFINYCCAEESHLSNLSDIYIHTGYPNFTLLHRRIINSSYYTHYVRRIPNLFYTYICVYVNSRLDLFCQFAGL